MKVSDPVWLRVLNTIYRSHGITQSALLRKHRTASTKEIERITRKLVDKNYVESKKVRTSGRPVCCWFPSKNVIAIN